MNGVPKTSYPIRRSVVSEYLVQPAAKGWGSWEEAVTNSGVKFTQEQLEIGNVLVGRNDPPEMGPHVVTIDHGGCSTTTVGWLLQKRAPAEMPVHPFALLNLAAGMRWSESDSRQGYRWTYSMAMSPFLLTAADGKNYILLLERYEIGLLGVFKDLSKDEDLPRCMHIWGRPYKKKERKLSLFRKESDGLYGQFYST